MVSTEHTRPVTPSGRLGVPAGLRSLVRRNEFGLIGLAVAIGIIGGLMVVAVMHLSLLFHLGLFGVPFEEHLSSMPVIEPPLRFAVPAVGGLLLGGLGLFIGRRRRRRPVDPIEANALQGGQMSFIDSFAITSQVVLSNGCGGSVGLEAGFTQIASGIASRLGAAFRLRRTDMRTVVGCGSAAAIAAAFGAPLTGAFYAFELIIGTYTSFGLAPIGAAAIAGVLTARLFGMEGGFVGPIAIPPLSQQDLAVLLVLAVLCAAIGIGVMRAVTFSEAAFKRSRLPAWLQPAVGGVVLGGLACLTPQVLASGHGALFLLLSKGAPALSTLAALFLLKTAASAVSIGSGFRGGLFFASLFLGALAGEIFADALALLDPDLAPPVLACAIVGMTSLAVAIIGGPLTMSFLALETTSNFPLSLLMLGASMIVSVFVRQTFGYSFATWRLHLRGESVRSAHDVGWMRALTVRLLMRPDVKTLTLPMTIAALRAQCPLGSTTWIAAVDSEGRYRGMVSVPEAHLDGLYEQPDRASADVLLRHADAMLVPQMNIKEAATLFETTESEALAVVDTRMSLRVVGLLTEAHVLRRYAEELDKARRDLAGESWLPEGR